MKKIILILLLLIQSFSYSQEENKATIIFNDNTTIEGLGEIKKNKIYFKVAPQDNYSEWDYTSVRGIIFSGYGFSEKYEYTKPDKNSNPVIMEIVDDGFVKLYRKNKLFMRIEKVAISTSNNLLLGNNRISEDMSTTYYVKREEEDFATDISFGFKARSLKYFADCKSLTEKIYNRTFTAENIIEMINYYNNYCDGEEN